MASAAAAAATKQAINYSCIGLHPKCIPRKTVQPKCTMRNVCPDGVAQSVHCFLGKRAHQHQIPRFARPYPTGPIHCGHSSALQSSKTPPTFAYKLLPLMIMTGLWAYVVFLLVATDNSTIAKPLRSQVGISPRRVRGEVELCNLLQLTLLPNTI